MSTTKTKFKKMPTVEDIISHLTEKMLPLAHDSEERQLLEFQIENFEQHKAVVTQLIHFSYKYLSKSSNPIKDFVAIGVRISAKGALTDEAEIGMGVMLAGMGDLFGGPCVKNEDQEWVIPPEVNTEKPSSTNHADELKAQSATMDFLKKMGVGQKK